MHKGTGHTGVNIFAQFGFREHHQSGDHSVGRCPFCGADDHFYLNLKSTNKTWDCKRCGVQGGFKLFIEAIVDHCAAEFRGAPAKKLADNRHIKVDTLTVVRVGYHPITQQYVLPVFSMDGRDVLSVKLYDLKTLRNGAGCPSVMYGLWSPEVQTAHNIVVSEGEWDTLVIKEIIGGLAIPDTAAIGVPGAGTFKADTIPLFSGKNVYLMYDNDDAGQNGMAKAIRLLSPVARRILCLKWPSGFPEGFDVRDLYKQHNGDGEALWTQLMEWMEIAELPEKRVEAAADVENGEPVPAERVYELYRKWLHIPDTTLIDVIFGTVMANRLPGDPVWVFIVAPPGATKTEPLLPLTGAAKIETLSTLTPSTLISGANFAGGGDPSLIPRLDGKILVVKDFTSVLNLPFVEREEIFGILRDAYDGECKKPFGNGIVRSYKSKFGMLAAVTPAIEMLTEDHAALGERFLRWRNYIPVDVDKQREYIDKAMGNVGKEDEMRQEMGSLAKDVLRAKYEFVPTMSKDVYEQVLNLAQLLSLLRGTVVRDKFTREIQHKSFTELGTRISKQLFKLLQGVALFRGREIVGQDEYVIARQICRGSVPQRLFDSVEYVWRNGLKEGVTASEVARGIGLPATTCSTVLDNLMMLNILRRELDEVRGNRVIWRLTEGARKLITKSKLFFNEGSK